MLPRASDATKSYKSATSERGRPSGLEAPVQFVKGVGPRLGAMLTSRGIATVRDLLFFFPRAYEDRTRLLKVSDLREGESGTVDVIVRSKRVIPVRSRRMQILEATCGDSSGTLSLKWFHFHRGMEQILVPGTELRVTGKIQLYRGQPQMLHPEVQKGKGADSSGDFNTGRVVPVYTELEGISTRQLRKMLWSALEKDVDKLGEDIPAAFLERYAFPHLPGAVRQIHFPPDQDLEKLKAFRTPAHLRLIYEEFLKFEYLVLRKRLNMAREAAPAFDRERSDEAVRDLAAALPFKLTGDQRKAVDEVLADLSLPTPMNRLIQGDVGSGKTAVAFLSCGAVLAAGGQAALMAPTEILAEQHYRNCVRLFGGRVRCELITGKTSAAKRKEILPRLAAGQPMLLIGTHALIEEQVVFG
ncbi:MAG TPA: DEAD/DEAH box helicase, partial [Bdellovibrionota bacterium]|nr:DEAD/DEAH box helicase [Bdellovibrionota bacterium]